MYADDVWNNELTLEDGTDNLFSDEITVDLAAYAGKTIKVAFVFEFNDGYEVSIDDISISLDTNTDNINSINTSNINLFPNPTTGTVNITNTESNTVEVYNMVGQVISENNTVTKKVNLIK